MDGLHVLITGGSGYIGSRLIKAALARGWRVTVLGRKVWGQGVQMRHYSWSLGEPVPDGALGGADGWPPVQVVIHVAHAWDDPQEDGVNVRGTGLILEASRRAGARMVFCSSVSARDGALNRYGRIKFRIEGMLSSPGEVSARIGMVYGGPLQAQWGMLCRVAGLSPVLPMLEAGTPVQPIHLDDLCEGLLRLAAVEAPDRSVYGLAQSVPVPFGDVLKAIARHRNGRRLRIINIPLGLALAGVAVAGRIPGLPSIDPERLLGLAGLPVIDTRESLAALGLVLRPLDEGLAPESWRQRRAVLAEAAVLLRYVLGRPAPLWAARRYARAITPETKPLALPGLIRRFPFILRLIEPVDGAHPLRRRLYIAGLTAEATPDGGRIYHDYKGDGLGAAACRLAGMVLVEILCFPFRLLLGRRR